MDPLRASSRRFIGDGPTDTPVRSRIQDCFVFDVHTVHCLRSAHTTAEHGREDTEEFIDIGAARRVAKWSLKACSIGVGG